MKGTPLRQAGDLSAAAMDIERLKALGVAPLQAVWERIAKVDGPRTLAEELAEELARLELFTSQPVIFGVTVTLGLDDPTRYVVMAGDVAALKERNALLAEHSLEDTKAYLQWEVLRLTSPCLSPAFVDVQAPLAHALTGQTGVPGREQVVAKSIARNLGQLYIERHVPARNRADAEALVNTVRVELRQWLQHNTWLTPPTRDHALEKLGKIKISVGHPDKWIDHASVDFRRDDCFGDVARLNEFAARRSLALLGQPPAPDAFSDLESSSPSVVNAGHSPTVNGIEIPAAIPQPPSYDPKADAGRRRCVRHAREEPDQAGQRL